MNHKIIIPLIIFAGFLFVTGCEEKDLITDPSLNHAPILEMPPNTSATIGDTLKVWLKATDIDDDSLTYTVTVRQKCSDFGTGYSPEAAIDPRTGYFWFAPGLDDLSLHNFMFVVTDHRGGYDFDSLIVTVIDSIIPDIDLDKLLSTPIEVEFNGHHLRADANIWGNYLLSSCWTGGYIWAYMHVIDMNNESPPDIELKYLWAVYEQDVWAIAIKEADISIGEDRLHVSFLNGPPWPPESSVDVIIGALDPTDPTEQMIFLRSPNVLINSFE